MSLKKKLTVLTFEELCRQNTAPVLRTDSNWVKEDGPVKATGNVLKAITHPGAPFGSFADRADTDADGNVLKVTTTGTFFGKFGILTLNANGTYSYKLYTSAQKPAAAKAVQGLSEGETLTESFKYKATDGFVTKGSVLKITIFGTDDPVTITDLTPAAKGGDAVVDEDGLPGGLLDAGRTGETDSTESATATGNFKISAPDGIDDLLVGGTAVITNGVFTPVTITTPLGNELKIIAFNAATGVVTYTYTLLAAETHPGAGEDSIFEQFAVKLTDVDGSSATASLDIRIVDDQPTIEVCQHDDSEETFSTTGVIVDECVPPGALIVDETTFGTDATSNFAGAFISDFGADGPGTIVYSLQTSGGPSGLVDTLTGDPVVVALEGGALVGRAGPGGPIVLVISINAATGEVTFDQQRAVVHDPNFGPNDFEGLPFDLVKVTATITDKDGDTATATLDAGNLFGIFDDAPSATDEPAQNVDEGGTISGTFDFAPGNDGATVTAINGTVLVFGLDGFSQVIDLGLGTIKVKADGSYEFTADNPTNSPVPPINGTFTVTDGDGDPAVGNFTFNIQDANTPTGGVASAAVDDDGLSGGNPLSTVGDLDANAGEVPLNPSEAIYNGTLGGSVGGDVPGTFSFAALHGTSVTVGLESANLTWAGNILTATGPRGVLFTVEVTDPATGAYTVTLVDNVLHAGGSNDEEINAVVNLGYVITDSDGSTAPGTLTVVFDDDAPTVSLNGAMYGDAILDETSPASTAPAINIGALVAGEDPDVTGAGAISTATSAGPVVSPTIAFGADGPAVTGSIAYTLVVGAVPPGLNATDGSPILLVSVSPTVVAGVVQSGTFAGQAAFAIEIDSVTGVVTVEQYLSLDHPANPNPNDVLNIADFALIAQIRVTDGDNDQAVAGLSIGNKISFFDDGPSLTVTVDPYAKAALDETATTSTAATLVVADIGDDAHVGGSGAIATATGMGPVVSANALFGADGPAAGGGTVFALNVLDPNSGLFTTDGSAITLVEEVGGLVVGRVASGVDSGKAAFAIAISATGVLTIEQYLSLDHPSNPNPDDTVFLATGTLGVDVTVTDGDGDSLTKSADISAQICFDDDGPSLTVVADPQIKADLDETATTSTPAALGVSNIGDDADVGGSGAISTSTTSGPLVTATALFGSDGPAASSPTVYALNVTDAASGLFATDGSAITLFEEAGLIVGRVASGTLAGQAAFAISIDATTGVVKVEQYLSLQHPLNPDPNDVVFLDTGTVEVTVTVTDGDGDSLTAGADVSGQFCFHDDGPTAYSFINPNLTDDEGKGDFAGESNEGEATSLATDADVAGSPATASGPAGTLFSAGADGLQSIAISGPAGIAAIYDPGTGLPAQEALVYSSTTDLAGNVTLTASGPNVGIAFTLTINTDGSYLFTQSAALVHPLFNPSNEDDLPLPFNFTVTDKDGDPASGTLTITVDDDTPVGGNVTEDVTEIVTLTNLMLIVDVSGSMGDPSGIPGLNRLQAAQQAMTDLINAYDANGDVVVRIVTFSSGATEVGSQWMSATDAIAAIGALIAGGTTNYDAAIETAAPNAFTDPGKIAGGQNVSYFLSDGNPNVPAGDAGISAAEEAAWEIFLDTNDIVSFSLGMGTGVSATQLNPIAYNGVTNVDTNAVIVDDFADLSGVLVGNATPILVSGTAAGQFGADGGSLSLTAAGAPAGFTYEVSGNTLLVKTSPGGTTVMTVTLDDPLTGAYTVKQNAPIPHAPGTDTLQFVFSLAVTDGDLDGAISTITLNVDDTVPVTGANPAVQLDDDALTNGNPGGIGDVNPDTANTTGTLNFSFGADGGSIAFLTTGNPAGFTYVPSGNNILIKQGSTTVVTVTLNPATGGYTVTQNAPILHAPGGDENDQSFTLTYRVTDSEGDFADGTLVINVDDDTPVVFNPHSTALLNNGTAVQTALLDLDGDIDNNAGADGFGSLTFINIVNGQSSGLTSGGAPILLFLTAGDTVLEGRTGSAAGPKIFTVTLTHDAGGNDTYTVDMDGLVDNGAGVTFNDLSGGTAGNPPFKIIESTSTDPLELLLTPINNGSINSDTDDIGVGSQFIDIGNPDQGLRVDFGDFTFFPNGGGSADDGFTMVSHSTVNGFRFRIDQISNGTTADVRLRAVNANEGGTNQTISTHNFGDDTTLTITEVQIFDALGVLVGTATADTSFGGIGIDFEGSGNVLITDLLADYSVVTRTASGYDRIEITNAGVSGAGSTDGKFSIGGLSVATASIGVPIQMNFDVALTDGDGDLALPTSEINISLLPNSSTTLIGNSSGNSLTGDNSVNSIAGLAGTDTISGVGNNDFLIGGADQDSLTGGTGIDVFYFGATSDSPTLATADLIVDFDGDPAGGQDVIDLSDIDANALTSTLDDAFGFVAGATSSVVQHSITWEVSGGQVLVRGDVNGDTTADFVIRLTNNASIATLQATDFVL